MIGVEGRLEASFEGKAAWVGESLIGPKLFGSDPMLTGDLTTERKAGREELVEELVACGIVRFEDGKVDVAIPGMAAAGDERIAGLSDFRHGGEVRSDGGAGDHEIDDVRGSACLGDIEGSLSGLDEPNPRRGWKHEYLWGTKGLEHAAHHLNVSGESLLVIVFDHHD